MWRFHHPFLMCYSKMCTKTGRWKPVVCRCLCSAQPGTERDTRQRLLAVHSCCKASPRIFSFWDPLLRAAEQQLCSSAPCPHTAAKCKEKAVVGFFLLIQHVSTLRGKRVPERVVRVAAPSISKHCTGNEATPFGSLLLLAMSFWLLLPPLFMLQFFYAGKQSLVGMSCCTLVTLR